MKYLKIVIISILIINIWEIPNLQAQVGINIDTPKSTLDINGDLIISQTDLTPGLLLGIDRPNNGHVGTLATSPYIFAQSSQEQIFSTTEVTEYNAARGVVVKWNSSTDILHNDIATFDTANNIFVFKNKYLCEISGFVCMKTGAPNTVGSSCFINIKIQQRKSGSSTWVDVGMTRTILNYPLLDQTTSTIVFTPCVADFNVGDALRVLMVRPSASMGTAWGARTTGIAMPGGIPYTRGLKILSL